MNSFELTTLVNTLASAIAKDVDDNQLALLAAIFTQLGDTLGTIGVFRELSDNNSNTNQTEVLP